MARLINCPGWLLMAWGVTGILTISGDLEDPDDPFPEGFTVGDIWGGANASQP